MNGLALRIEHACRSHPGAVRSVNEDSAISRQQPGLWAVADGMGGYVGGRWCSQIIAEALEQAPLAGTIERATERVLIALARANTTILAASERVGSTMGSTVAVLLVRDGRYSALWAGDSRIYRCRNRRLDQLTTDHSQVERLICQGLLDRKDAHNHPLRHVLARTLGATPTLVIDRTEGSVEPGDMFLLCSDGLSGEVRCEEMEQIMLTAPPREAVTRLVDRALDRGAPDNVTAIVLSCDIATQLGPLQFAPA